MLELYCMPPPALPRFVLITSAPFAASMPYSAAASGPFSTVSVSMSCEFRSAARLVKSTPRLLNAVTELLSDASTPVLTVRLSIGRPSTMISGWLLLLIELTPRMTRDEDAPGTRSEERRVGKRVEPGSGRRREERRSQ